MDIILCVLLSWQLRKIARRHGKSTLKWLLIFYLLFVSSAVFFMLNLFNYFGIDISTSSIQETIEVLYLLSLSQKLPLLAGYILSLIGSFWFTSYLIRKGVSSEDNQTNQGEPTSEDDVPKDLSYFR